MSWVEDVLSDAADDIGDVLSDVGDFVIDEIIDPIVNTVGNVIEAALDDPITTIAKIAAVATGNAWALPLIDGASVAVKGGDLQDVLEATAKAYVMQEVGSSVGGATTAAVAKTTGSAVAGEIVGSAAGSAAVAVVSGQDPLKAFVTGGVGAAVPAVLGKVTGFKSLPDSAQRAISSAVTTQLSGGNVTASLLNSAISASGIVTKALKSFDPDGTKLDNTQRAILTDVLMGTATAAITGGSPSNVINAALMKAGSKALGDMATKEFKDATKSVTEAYEWTDGKAELMDVNIAAQKDAADNYNDTAEALKKKIDIQNKLQTASQDAITAYNANPSQATADKANAATKTYNDYVTALNKEYSTVFQPKLDKYGKVLDDLKEDYAVLEGDYEKAIKAFGTKTDTLSDILDPIYRTSNRAFVETMDENFNAEQYRKLNGLTTDQDPYEHYLSKGQFENAPTNDKAAQATFAQERTRLITGALAAKGVTVATADPAMVSQMLDNIDAKYGNNVSALKAASIQDVINGNTAPLAELVADQKSGTFRVEVNGTSYGEWNKPATDKFTSPAGTKLASFEAFNSGKAALQYTTDGRPVWVEADPTTAVESWNPATSSAVIPTLPLISVVPTEQERILAMAELGEEDVVQGTVSRAALNAAKTLVGWAQQSGNSTLINTTANIMKAGGGFIESVNGMSVLLGVAPSTTKMGKFANALQDIGKAGNTADYKAAVANMKSLIGDAKGVGGTLKAIYGAFESAPLQFLAEYVGVEGIQEVAPLLIGGVVAGGAKGAALALKYGEAVAAKMGSAAGMTSAIATNIAESAGGAATNAYNETYKVALKAGKTPAEADKIAMDVAQRQAFIAGGVTAVSMGIGGAALEKAVLGKSGTGLGDALQSLGDFAKTGTKIAIKEGVSEGGEEGLTQAALEGQLYKLDPTRDVAKEITQAAAFGVIAGGPIAGGAYGASRTGDVISNMTQGNSKIADILETNKGNPAAADAALAKFGVTDNTIKSNLMNTIDNANYTSSDEAAVELGKRSDYTYSDADIKALTGKGTDTTLTARAEAYVDPKVFDIEEVKAAAKAEGYTLTDEQAAKLVGQKNEATATTAAQKQFDPLATTYEEAKQILTDSYKALGFTVVPTDEQIAKFVGSVAENTQKTAAGNYVGENTVTTTEAKKYLTDLGYKPTDAEVAKFVGAVNEKTQVSNIATYVDPLLVDKDEVKEAYAKAGLKEPTDEDITRFIGQYAESELTTKVKDFLPTASANVISSAKTDILAKMAEYEKAGKTRDEALSLAIDDVAKDLGTTRTDILNQIGAPATVDDPATKDVNEAKPATGIYADIGDVKTDIQTKYEALTKEQKALADQLTQQGVDLNTAIDTAIGDVKTDIQTKYDALTTEQKNLADQLTQQGVDLNTAINSVKTTLGQNTQQATQSDLDAMITLLEQNGAYNPEYDYNGDKVIDQKDKIAIETYIKSQDSGYIPDTEDPFVYNPAAGSKWASTGVFKTIEEEAEATRQAQAAEAERTRQEQATRTDALSKANAAQAIKTQRMGNLNNLMNMLGQAQDTGGQQVTVKAADPAKIGYVYDFSSIFANPAQEKMFASPYAQGGVVDGSEDVNDELLKILKG
jgi:hypothetical protein